MLKKKNYFKTQVIPMYSKVGGITKAKGGKLMFFRFLKENICSAGM